MRRALAGAALVLLLGAGAAWVLTTPDPLPAAELEALAGDARRGEVLFAAAGCASCHVAPEGEVGSSPVLSGGRRFATGFGTFLAPASISSRCGESTQVTNC